MSTWRSGGGGVFGSGGGREVMQTPSEEEEVVDWSGACEVAEDGGCFRQPDGGRLCWFSCVCVVEATSSSAAAAPSGPVRFVLELLFILTGVALVVAES